MKNTQDESPAERAIEISSRLSRGALPRGEELALTNELEALLRSIDLATLTVSEATRLTRAGAELERRAAGLDREDGAVAPKARAKPKT